MAKMPNQLRHPLWKRQCQSLRFRPIRMQRLWKLVFFRPLFHHHLRQCLHLQALPSLRLLNQRKPNHQQSQHNHQHQNRSQQGRVSNRIFPMGQLARLGVEMWSTVFTNHAIKSSPLFYIVFLLNSHMIILSLNIDLPLARQNFGWLQRQDWLAGWNRKVAAKIWLPQNGFAKSGTPVIAMLWRKCLSTRILTKYLYLCHVSFHNQIRLD